MKWKEILKTIFFFFVNFVWPIVSANPVLNNRLLHMSTLKLVIKNIALKANLICREILTRNKRNSKLRYEWNKDAEKKSYKVVDNDNNNNNKTKPCFSNNKKQAELCPYWLVSSCSCGSGSFHCFLIHFFFIIKFHYVAKCNATQANIANCIFGKKNTSTSEPLIRGWQWESVWKNDWKSNHWKSFHATGSFVP